VPCFGEAFTAGPNAPTAEGQPSLPLEELASARQPHLLQRLAQAVDSSPVPSCVYYWAWHRNRDRSLMKPTSSGVTYWPRRVNSPVPTRASSRRAQARQPERAVLTAKQAGVPVLVQDVVVDVLRDVILQEAEAVAVDGTDEHRAQALERHGAGPLEHPPANAFLELGRCQLSEGEPPRSIPQPSHNGPASWRWRSAMRPPS
jgi:hypothetical protein